MAATTTVYLVTAQDHMVRHWYFGTKGEARAFAREWRRENDSDRDYDPPEIEAVNVTLNARGVAQALNDFIDMTCANEG